MSLPGWMAPPVCTALFAFLAWKSLHGRIDNLMQPVGAATFAGTTAIGFLIGVAFWIRDRSRGK